MQRVFFFDNAHVVFVTFHHHLQQRRMVGNVRMVPGRAVTGVSTQAATIVGVNQHRSCPDCVQQLDIIKKLILISASPLSNCFFELSTFGTLLSVELQANDIQ